MATFKTKEEAIDYVNHLKKLQPNTEFVIYKSVEWAKNLGLSERNREEINAKILKQKAPLVST